MGEIILGELGKVPNISIIYEDNHLLVVEKPVNIPSQKDISGDPDMLSILKDDLKRRYNKPGNVFLGLVHRLDRPVGGVMVFAKTSKAASRLSDQIRKRKFGKVYFAVIHGIPDKPENTVVHYLVKDGSQNLVRAVKDNEEGAKEAVLDYRVLDSRDGMSLVRIKLHTGRSHQVRVQFSAIGHPLYGDQKYGVKFSKPGQQLALWSAEITLIHPTLKEKMTFVSKPPDVYPWNAFKGWN